MAKTKRKAKKKVKSRQEKKGKSSKPATSAKAKSAKARTVNTRPLNKKGEKRAPNKAAARSAPTPERQSFSPAEKKKPLAMPVTVDTRTPTRPTSVRLRSWSDRTGKRQAPK